MMSYEDMNMNTTNTVLTIFHKKEKFNEQIIHLLK